MMNILDTTAILESFLKDKLVDPIAKRYNSWIYSDETRIELDKSQFPKILLSNINTPNNKPLLAIGSTRTLNTDIFILTIKAKVGEHYGYGEEKYTAKEFVARIGREAEELIKSNHAFFVSQDLQSVLPVRDEYSLDNERNPMFKLTIEVQYVA